MTGRADICTAWGDRKISTNCGVKQGAVESPVLFVVAMSLILESVAALFPNDSWMDLGHDDLSFMDDAITWAVSLPRLQSRCDRLAETLQEWGLSINAAKCQLLCFGDLRGRTITIQGITVEALPQGQPMTVMGLPMMPGISPNDVLLSLLDRTRKAFWANRDLLTSSAPLKARVKLLQRTVWATISWTIGILFPTKVMLETLNTHMYNFLVIMCSIKRRPTESFVDYQLRSKRIARQSLWASGFERWSSLHLRLLWRYVGHCVDLRSWKPLPFRGSSRTSARLSGGHDNKGFLKDSVIKEDIFPALPMKKSTLPSSPQIGEPWQKTDSLGNRLRPSSSESLTFHGPVAGNWPCPSKPNDVQLGICPCETCDGSRVGWFLLGTPLPVTWPPCARGLAAASRPAR